LHQAVEIDATQGANGNNRAYNRNGNLTQNESGDLYEFDYANKLVKVSTKDANNLPIDVVFTYDCSGRKIQKTVTQTNTNTVIVDEHYYYSGEEVIAEYNGSDVLQRSFVLGERLDIPVSVTEGGFDYYFVYDTHGSVIAITNAVGVIEEKYKYDAHGNFEVLLDSTLISNRYFYAARDWEPEIKLYHNRARFYDPVNGFFIQRDPLGYVDGSNPYLYCSGNSANYTDPLGLEVYGHDFIGPLTEVDYRSPVYSQEEISKQKGIKQGIKDYRNSEIITAIRLTRSFDSDGKKIDTAKIIGVYDPAFEDLMGTTPEVRRQHLRSLLEWQDDVKEILTTGIQNDSNRSVEIARIGHTTLSTVDTPEKLKGADKIEAIVLNHGTHGLLADLSDAVMNKIGGNSQTNKDFAEILYPRAKNNVNTLLINHSDGAFKIANALKYLRRDFKVKNWTNLETEWHGSPVNVIKSWWRTRRVGGRFFGVSNHPLDLVSKLGTNSVNLPMYAAALVWSPTLSQSPRQEIGVFGSNHTIYNKIKKRQSLIKAVVTELLK